MIRLDLVAELLKKMKRTQNIKNMFLAWDWGEFIGIKAIMGALTLYLDFINLFIMLLRLFGQRR